MPTVVAVFAEDLSIRRFAVNTVVHWSESDRGGHFAALEDPEFLASDIKTFFTERSSS